MNAIQPRQPQPSVSEEEFGAWRDEPITRRILDTLGAMADAQREGWLTASWEGGNNDPLLLTELRTRADAYRALAEGSYADFFGVDA